MATEPHYVSRDDVEAAYYLCAKCGERVDGDGDGFWHENPALNPDGEARDPESRPCPACGAALTPTDTHYNLMAGAGGAYECPTNLLR